MVYSGSVLVLVTFKNYLIDSLIVETIDVKKFNANSDDVEILISIQFGEKIYLKSSHTNKKKLSKKLRILKPLCMSDDSVFHIDIFIFFQTI